MPTSGAAWASGALGPFGHVGAGLVAPPVGLRAVYLERDGWVLELLHFDRPGNEPARRRSFTEPGLTHLSLTVDDLSSACALVTEHGGEVLEETDVSGMAIMVRDPDGQLLELLPGSTRV